MLGDEIFGTKAEFLSPDQHLDEQGRNSPGIVVVLLLCEAEGGLFGELKHQMQ